MGTEIEKKRETTSQVQKNCVRTFSRSIKDMMRNYVQKLKEGSTLWLQQGLKLSVSQEQGVNALHN